jgi:2-C-methyl-D-erythritol 2,4-cyclodiphosphate synthase
LDVHAFGPGDHVTLGGVRIPHEQGLAAHSDGDVLLHALCDALLGGAALGDIGRHFPPSDQRWEGADSRDLLRRVRGMLEHAGWSVVNVDMTVICEQPRIAPHAEQMCRHIASDLRIGPEWVSVKATTSERLGFCGRGEGIAASGVILLQSAVGTDGAGE